MGSRKKHHWRGRFRQRATVLYARMLMFYLIPNSLPKKCTTTQHPSSIYFRAYKTIRIHTALEPLKTILIHIDFSIAHISRLRFFPAHKKHINSYCFEAAQKLYKLMRCVTAHNAHLRFISGPWQPYWRIFFQNRSKKHMDSWRFLIANHLRFVSGPKRPYEFIVFQSPSKPYKLI